MSRVDQREKAVEEWSRARFLHQNYLHRLRDEPSKAGEHLWGGINCLASAIHRLRNGSGISQHRDVLRFLDELAVESELDEHHVDAAETLHGHYYHDHLREERLRRELERAGTLYDCLDRLLGGILEREPPETGGE